MDIVYRRCAGLDIHKKFLVAAVRVLDERDTLCEHVERFGTLTRDLLALSDWLAQHGVTHVAMESTGVLWKPVYRVLEERFTAWVCNARHLKQVPGRKTDVKDARWIAQLLQCGLLKPSFVPPRPLRELRDLTRHRVRLVEDLARVKNRIHQLLDEANVKLGAVASDILGVAARAVLEALAKGEADPRALAALTQGRLKAATADIEAALQGELSEHPRFLLELLLLEVTAHERLLEKLDARIQELVESGALDEPAAPGADAPLPFAQAVEVATSIPGVSRTGAIAILAETGCAMSRFPDAGHLAAWAGLSPGQNESAGRPHGSATRKGNRFAKRALAQAAWAAARAKGTYLQARYRRLAQRRGRKRAVVAVAHTLVVALHAMLGQGALWLEAGADYYDRLDQERLTRYHLKRLQQLGHRVTIQAA